MAADPQAALVPDEDEDDGYEADDNEENNNGEQPAAVPPAPPLPEGGDDPPWNPMDWNPAAEELTWERLLGLDGSLMFLEHVVWVVSLNTMFILVFGRFPLSVAQA